MSMEEKRKNIIHYYITITTGVALGFLNSNVVFFLSIAYMGPWWSYLGIMIGLLGIYYGMVRLKIDYQTLRHSLENIKK